MGEIRKGDGSVRNRGKERKKRMRERLSERTDWNGGREVKVGEGLREREREGGSSRGERAWRKPKGETREERMRK